jgi:hypothetical protein
MTVHFRRLRTRTEDCTVEDPPPYHAGPTDSAEPPLTTEDLIALAHAQRQGIPYETGEQWLARLPERLHDLSDLILSGKMQGGDVAYALAALIDSIESASADARKVH